MSRNASERLKRSYGARCPKRLYPCGVARPEEPSTPPETPRWYVLRDRVRAVLLEHPRQENLFWWSYAVSVVPGAEVDPWSPAFWEGTFEVEHERSGVRIASRLPRGCCKPRMAGALRRLVLLLIISAGLIFMGWSE